MRVYNDFAILARDVSIDSKDKMMSIFKIIDKFNFSLEPDSYKKFIEETREKTANMPAHFVTSSSWSLDKPTKKDIRAIIESKIIDPRGKELGKSRNDVVFAAGLEKVRLNGVVDGLPVTLNGYYKVELRVLDPKTEKVLSSGTVNYQVNVEENKQEKLELETQE